MTGLKTGRRKNAVVAMACGLSATVLVVGCGGGSSHPSASGKDGSAGGSTSSSPQATPQSVAQAFLTAWSGNDYAGAGALTDDTANATNRLKAVMGSLAPQKLTLALGDQQNVPAGGGSGAGSASGSASGPASSASSASTAASSAAAAPLARFSFTVTADFGNNLVWTYPSSLDLVQGPAGAPVVHWSSAVINPQLGGTALLKAVAPKQQVLDASGNPIDLTRHPTLGPAMTALSTHVPANTTPTQLTVQFVDSKTGSQIPQSKDWVLGTAAPGTTPTVKTTIDPKVQSAIESALNGHPNGGMVVIQPSTGHILGMASNDPGITSLAYKAARAPGSTFKVITTALALQRGLSVTDPVKCGPKATVEDKDITNDSSLANGIPNATLKEAFEQSCNTAFVNLALDGKLGTDYGALANEAKTYFGLNQKWDLGLGPATYGTAGDQQVPPADGPGLFARDAFGQGNISMSPLTMASVAATVANNGVFKQPILVPGTPQIPATPLPANVASQLNTLMQGVIYNSDGTAYGVLNGVSGLAGKTGSAESNDTPTTKKTDSWMIVYDRSKDLAFGALVLNGGFGIQNAGPAILTALHTLGIR